MDYLSKVLLVFLYLAAPCYAAVPWLPSNPSSNLHVLKRQVVFHNVNRLLTEAKSSDGDIREAAKLTKLVQNVSTQYKPNPKFTTKFGYQPQREVFYAEIFVILPTFVNTIDLANKKYSFEVHYKSYTFYIHKPLEEKSYSLGICKAFYLK